MDLQPCSRELSNRLKFIDPLQGLARLKIQPEESQARLKVIQ